MGDTLQNLSADELFELAEKRRQEEAEAEREAKREQVQSLKNHLKQMDKDHRARVRALEREHQKARAAVEAELSALTGSTRSRSAKGMRRDGISAVILGILQAQGELSTKAIKAHLDEQGITPKNLAQTLAYLKSRGQIVSLGHATYRAA
ncbi:hypothetical protein D5125_02890 [Magnetovirga frankeli]|uniref:hypothetical protein n=1 Tax=Magnetovirga frankeli TaxID=947516 RepID=UPI0012937B39|nr:hypothetical protein D5125_02890 [gamma proteobacterium SS-5]